MTASIVDLEEAVTSLPATARAAAGRILAISTTIGRLEPPPEMHEWIRKFFGSVEAVREQRIVRVSNQVTFEGALFNELRALRPMEVKGGDEVRATIASSANDPFCRPETGTPADVFGRVEGRWGITASNVAKYDGFHGVLVFKEHDPLAPLDAAAVRDHLTTARRWAERALEVDPAARYYFLLWNCLWRAGGSIVHGHMQMTATRGRVMASLVPIKEREIMVLGRPGADESSLGPAIAKAVAALRAAGVVSYNMALYLPPLSPDGEDWRRFPPLARLVDRGDPANKTSDIGAMELYASSVIAADPFRLAEALRA